MREWLLLFVMTISLPALAENACAKAQEAWQPFLPGTGYVSCCKGLVSTSKWLHSNLTKDCLPGPPGDSGYCVQCGDGKCDDKHFENKCNCPKDCNSITSTAR